jgi:SAM-dependent methyltransferase
MDKNQATATPAYHSKLFSDMYDALIAHLLPLEVQNEDIPIYTRHLDTLIQRLRSTQAQGHPKPNRFSGLPNKNNIGSDGKLRILDFGTGTGRVVKELYKYANQPENRSVFFFLEGADVGDSMLDRAREEIKVLENEMDAQGNGETEVEGRGEGKRSRQEERRQAREEEKGRRSGSAKTDQSTSTNPNRRPRNCMTWFHSGSAANAFFQQACLDMFIFSAGGISHLTRGDEGEEIRELLVNIKRGLFDHGIAVISILNEFCENHPDATHPLAGVESGKASKETEVLKIQGKKESGVTYLKHPTKEVWDENGKIRTDIFKIEMVTQQDGIVKQSEILNWEVRIINEKYWKNWIDWAGLIVIERIEAEIQTLWVLKKKKEALRLHAV